jgi:hypothetical protein
MIGSRIRCSQARRLSGCAGSAAKAGFTGEAGPAGGSLESGGLINGFQNQYRNDHGAIMQRRDSKQSIGQPATRRKRGARLAVSWVCS